MIDQQAVRRPERAATVAAVVIGLASSGFFDGILLHQVLQWHHFLSLAPGTSFRDLRMQVYADGLFHAAVYMVAVFGLFLMWRARTHLDRPEAAARIVGGGLLGFGLWNIADVGLFHWILGFHRVRLNVPNPMAYDLGWFLVLGVLITVAGLWVLRRGPRMGPPRRAAATIVAALLAAVPVANIPAPGGRSVIIFRPGLGPAGAINAVVAAEGRIVMIEPGGGFAVAELPRDRSDLTLYRAGALLVTRSPGLAGCLAFTATA